MPPAPVDTECGARGGPWRVPLAQEGPSLVGPASADFPSKHNESGPSLAPNQLRARSFLPPPGGHQRCAVVVSRARACRPVAVQSGEGRVDRQLCAAKQWQPSICRIWCHQVHISDDHVCGDTCASFATKRLPKTPPLRILFGSKTRKCAGSIRVRGHVGHTWKAALTRGPS